MWDIQVFSVVNAPPSLPGPPVLTFVTFASADNTTANVATFTGMNIGPTAGFTTRRIIVVLLAAHGSAGFNGGLSSVTIGGITATIHVATNTSTNDVAVVSADVPTGTTATIVATCAGNLFQTMIAATYSVDDAKLVSTTPTGTGSNSSTAVTSLATSSVTTSAGGFIVTGEAQTTAPTGLAVTGETTDGLGGTNVGIYASASSLAGGSLTPTATWSNSSDATIAAAAWR